MLLPAAAAEFMKQKWKWLFMTRLKTNASKWREQGALDLRGRTRGGSQTAEH